MPLWFSFRCEIAKNFITRCRIQLSFSFSLETLFALIICFLLTDWLDLFSQFFLFLSGYRNLSAEVEEGICQALSHMWLESEVMPGSTTMPSSSKYASSSSSSSSSSWMPLSKKAGKSDIDKKLGQFFMYQIAHDTSTAYGEGFRAANAAVNKYGLPRTLDHIRLTRSFPIWKWLLLLWAVVIAKSELLMHGLAHKSHNFSWGATWLILLYVSSKSSSCNTKFQTIFYI